MASWRRRRAFRPHRGAFWAMPCPAASVGRGGRGRTRHDLGGHPVRHRRVLVANTEGAWRRIRRRHILGWWRRCGPGPVLRCRSLLGRRRSLELGRIWWGWCWWGRCIHSRHVHGHVWHGRHAGGRRRVGDGDPRLDWACQRRAGVGDGHCQGERRERDSNSVRSVAVSANHW